MTARERFCLLVLALAQIAGPGAAATPSTAPAAASAGQASARCQVWRSELSFAQWVADSDAAALAVHLHPQAVFGVSGQATRGGEPIAAQWQGGSSTAARWCWNCATAPGRVYLRKDLDEGNMSGLIR